MDRVLTIPNVISVARLCCLPWFVWLVFGAENEIAASWLLIILGCTDWVDGYIARRFDQISTFGKVIDPTADRLMLGVVAISLMAVGAVPIWLGVAALAREVVIGIGGIYLGLHGHKRLDVQYVGKVGAFALMASFPGFLLAHGDSFAATPLLIAAWVLGLIGLFFSWYSLVGYVKRGRALMNAENPKSGTAS